MNKVKSVLFSAGISLALAFIFGCAGDKDDGGDDNQGGNNGGSGTNDLCGGVSYDQSIYRCESGELIGKCRGQDYYVAYEQCVNGVVVNNNSNNSSSSPCDIKDYRTVKIGNQVWMAENLNCHIKGAGSRCYAEGVVGVSTDSVAKNCAKYGRLYNWAAAMDIDTIYNKKEWDGSDVKHRGICPSGWHIPSDAEWTTLLDFVGGTDIAGTKLKTKSDWHDCYNPPGSGNLVNKGTDNYDFSALPGGFGSSDGSFYHVGISGSWWSATESGSNYAYYKSMSCSSERVSGANQDKVSLRSVRCLQD